MGVCVRVSARVGECGCVNVYVDVCERVCRVDVPLLVLYVCVCVSVCVVRVHVRICVRVPVRMRVGGCVLERVRIHVRVCVVCLGVYI